MGLFRRTANKVGSSAKVWVDSQKYELEHAIGFMDAPFFRQLFAETKAGKLNLSTGHRDSLMLKEFFGGARAQFDQFVAHITDKSCLDVGPCVLSPLSAWDVAKQRFAVEPLVPSIEAWQRKHLGGSVYEGITAYPIPGEQLVPEIVGKIDGAILCRNMLDHTPKWPFVLANISAYAARGCRLLLWTDLDHRGDADEGHYDITTEPEHFRNFVVQLGFDIQSEYSDTQRHELNWGCSAVKR
jgi:hypothetical protein